MIEQIFGSPIKVVHIGRELSIVENYETDYYYDKVQENLGNVRTEKNLGNKITEDRWILDSGAFPDIKTFCEAEVKKFFDETWAPDYDQNPDLELYITQSWLTYTEPGGFHQPHEHPNSLISGVFYLNANPNTDSLTFYMKNRYNPIEFISKKVTPWNSKVASFPAKTGQLIMFPSHLTHVVEETTSEVTRSSLAFNTFVRGTIGNTDRLSRITIK